MRQITKEEAIQISESKLYEDWSDEEIVNFQLFQRRLAMPFSVFHEAVNKVFKRSVFIHEFGANIEDLKKEFLREKLPPTFDEIVSMIPGGKSTIVKDSESNE